jgi:hypothetical protein
VVNGEIRWVKERRAAVRRQGKLIAGMGSTQTFPTASGPRPPWRRANPVSGWPQMAGMVFDWDPEPIRSTARRGSEGFGARAESRFDRHWWQADSSGRRAPGPAEVVQCLKSRCDRLQMEYRLCCDDGRWVHIR